MYDKFPFFPPYYWKSGVYTRHEKEDASDVLFIPPYFKINNGERGIVYYRSNR